jgi:phage tail sheath protein FI
MPSTLTYPGVYIEEIPSGVHTIMGVSTSVTAFVGTAKRGPINKAVHLLSYSDFERGFGGLSTDSEMSYAVRQFFANGGSEAWVVRLAKNSLAAKSILKNSTPTDVLMITALDEGFSGNNIEVRIDYQTVNAASTFNLSLNYVSSDSPAENRSEVFQNLSMNSQDARYVENLVNGVSQLVQVTRVADSATLEALDKGASLSGDLSSGGVLVDVATLRDANHDQIQVAVNGSTPTTVQITDADLVGADADARLAALCGAIQTKVRAAVGTNPLLDGFTCAPSTDRILMTSGVAGETSSVRVLPGVRNDLSARLKLGMANGGTETDAASAIRPVEMPANGTLTGGVLTATDVPASGDSGAIPDTTHTGFKISLDGDPPGAIDLGTTAAGGAAVADRLGDLAHRIQVAVSALKPSKPAYRDFTVTVSGGNRLVLTSGSRGQGSSVVVSAADSKDIAGKLKLLADATVSLPQNATLQGGTESAYTDADAYNLFIGDRSLRKGIYALESVDLYNILCLPGASDPGILQDADAYCSERRAFLLIDPPKTTTTPDAMGALATGSALPKSKNAAVYYPWIKIADPLNGGALRDVAPSGTIAGLYARIDSARGVWKAPAGTEATLVGVQAVDYVLTDRENGVLNPHGANCIRLFPVFGPVAWGARTLQGDDQMTSEWKYIPVRRLALFIEESLYRGTKWVVFEPNDEPLWAQIRLNIGAFMQTLFLQGAFQGSSPKDAYFVKCDKETTTQNDINLGVVNILVGFAPLKPAEFVVIKLQQMAGQIQV